MENKLSKEDLICDILKFTKHKKLTKEDYKILLEKQSYDMLAKLWIKAIEMF